MAPVQRAALWLPAAARSPVRAGAFVTDVTNAARTNLMELATQRWHAPTMRLFGVREGMLPEIRSCAQHLGTFQQGPLEGVPITGAAPDAAVAAGCCRARAEADLRCLQGAWGTSTLRCWASSAGSTRRRTRTAPAASCCCTQVRCARSLAGLRLAGFSAVPKGGAACAGEQAVRSRHGLITTLAYRLGPDAPVQYALEGAIAVGGSGVSWLRDNLGLIQSAADVEALAGSVDSTQGGRGEICRWGLPRSELARRAGVYFVPAFNGLLAPHWRPDARGALLGLSGSSTSAHIARAMLEAICWQVGHACTDGPV